MSELEQFVVYEKPRDHPEHFVVRRWVIRPGHAMPDAAPWALESTLDAARAAIPRGLFRLARSADDDPVIVEVWL